MRLRSSSKALLKKNDDIKNGNYLLSLKKIKKYYT